MSKKDNFKILYALSLAWQLGFLIAIPLAVFLWLGILADKALGTRPLFLILSLFAAIAITAYEVYHWLMPLIKKTKKND
jgi:F0F1-type ATP synthase assembly protein I